MSSSDGSERSSLYRVRLAPRALKDVEELYEFIACENSAAAERWVAELFDSVQSLSHFPRRCAFAPEDKYLGLGIRQLVVGKAWLIRAPGRPAALRDWIETEGEWRCERLEIRSEMQLLIAYLAVSNQAACFVFHSLVTETSLAVFAASAP